MKEIKTTNELIDYLKDKGITIDNCDLTKEKLEDYTYYGIINSYKDLFKEPNGKYKNNVTFNEIFALYEFDMNIRALFLKYILQIELVLKSRIANLFTEKYGLSNYINTNNFNNKSLYQPIVLDLINKIESEIATAYGKHEAITHYQDSYGYIPPFVLVKILTIGTISRFYGMMQQKDQQRIAKTFNVSDNTLKVILKNLTFVRNICAHSERLYCYTSINTISTIDLGIDYNLPNNKNNLYIIIKSMEKLLKTDKYLEFKNCFDNEIEKLKNKLNSISISDILTVMGFLCE